MMDETERKERAEKINKNRADRQKRDWEWMLASEKGRRIALELLNACGVDRHSFVPADPYATAFHAGQQSIGLWVRQLAQEANPEALLQMKREYESELKSQENELKENINE